jgi:hypothetical protein
MQVHEDSIPPASIHVRFWRYCGHKQPAVLTVFDAYDP